MCAALFLIASRVLMLFRLRRLRLFYSLLRHLCFISLFSYVCLWYSFVSQVCCFIETRFPILYLVTCYLFFNKSRVFFSDLHRRFCVLQR